MLCAALPESYSSAPCEETLIRATLLRPRIIFTVAVPKVCPAEKESVSKTAFNASAPSDRSVKVAFFNRSVPFFGLRGAERSENLTSKIGSRSIT